MGHELDEIKNISNHFNYGEKTIPVAIDCNQIMEESKSILEAFNGKKVLIEETLDDFDTVYESLKTGVEVEIKNFILNLLYNNVENFAWSFVTPTSETFKDAWEHVLTKYTVSDDRVKEQFLNRMKILFRNIFLEKMNIGDEQKAIELADAYYTVFKVAINQIIDSSKSKQVGTSAPLAQDVDNEKRDIEYY